MRRGRAGSPLRGAAGGGGGSIGRKAERRTTLAARGRTVRWALRRLRPPLTPGPLYSAPPRDDAAGEAARPEAACSHGPAGLRASVYQSVACQN